MSPNPSHPPLRSDANGEDLDDFAGAGLYDRSVGYQSEERLEVQQIGWYYKDLQILSTRPLRPLLLPQCPFLASRGRPAGLRLRAAAL